MATRRRSFRRARRKKPLWQWIPSTWALTWSSAELIAGNVTKNVILVDEPILSAYGCDSNTRVERIVGRMDYFTGGLANIPFIGYAFWNGLEDATDTPTNTPTGLNDVTPAGDAFARNDIMRMDRFHLCREDLLSGGVVYREIEFDLRVRRKIPMKGCICLASEAGSGIGEDGSILWSGWCRALVVADYR